MSKWINLIDEKPKDDQRVLITIKEGAEINHSIYLENEVSIGMYCDSPDHDGSWYPFFYEIENNEKLTDEVIAWMPLPEPYKEDEDDEQ